MKNNFIKIYSTLNATEAYIVKFLFENNGIETIMDNDEINFFFGIVSAKDAMAELWVPADKYKQAADLLIQKSSIDLSSYEQVRCAHCGEKNCGLFDYCWNCLTNLKTGELYRYDQPEISDAPRKAAKRPRTLYLLIILIAMVVFGYLTCFYFGIR
ncbi:MAG: hypothetical protein A2W19_08505 [Spirochaetes bacterium RBG_16_49_21]|nr:MAG: hypothetical protein A2W19_08505 [Spirochaetes bacterium RBG_16_49_21]